jgi:hypothetical protein
MNKTKKSCIVIFLVIICLGIAGIVTLFAGNLCPPQGPWPQPPGCGSSSGNVVRDDLGCFPPSCDLIPDEAAKIMCEQYKAGMEIWNWPDDCTLMPMANCVKLCNAEWQRHHEVGLQNWESDIKARAGDWYKEPYTKVYMFGTVNERHEIYQPDGQLGAYGFSDLQMQEQVDYAHFYNMAAISGGDWISFATIDKEMGVPWDAYREDQIPVEIQPAMGRNLDGNIAYQAFPEGDRTSDQTKPSIRMHSYEPSFLANQVEKIKRAIDFGAEGWYFDNLSATPGFMDTGNDFYDKFDDYTVSQFSEYLRTNLTDADWKAIGQNADDFNYVAFLKSKGYTVADFEGANKDWWSIPLIAEFRQFISQMNVDAFAEIARQGREYAQSKGRAFSISGNMTDPYINPIEEIADYKGFEQGYITADRPYLYKSVVPADKFSNAKGKVYLNYIWAGNYAQMGDILAENEDVFVDVYRMSIMENYAAKSGEVLLRTDVKGWRSLDDSIQIFKAHEDTTRLEKIKTAFDFMRAYKPYFADFNDTNAKAALLYLNGQVYQDFIDDPFIRYYYNVRDFGEALYNRGVDYDVVNEAMDFSPYSFLFLPSSISVNDETSQKILDFVKQGGTLIAVNQPKGLLENLKEGPLENGSIRIAKEDKWDEPADYISESIGSINSGDVGLRAVSYHDRNGNYVVHLFTPHTDLTRSFEEFRDIPLSLPFSIEGKNVSYASLENPEMVPLDAENIVIPAPNFRLTLGASPCACELNMMMALRGCPRSFINRSRTSFASLRVCILGFIYFIHE